MPIKVDFSSLRQSIEAKQRALSAQVVQEKLAQATTEYVERLTANMQGKVSGRATGNMQRAVTTIIPPWQVAGGWAAGVGDYAKIGDPNAAAPKDTIRDFKNWLETSGDARIEQARQKILQEQHRRVEQRRAAERAREAEQAHIVELQKAQLRARIEALSQELKRIKAAIARVNSEIARRGLRRRYNVKGLERELRALREQLENM